MGIVMTFSLFLKHLWAQYVAITPQAEAIFHLFESEGEVIENDHVAFRTFAHSHMDLAHLEPQILHMGFRVFDDYHFPKKHLFARSYVHQNSVTKIFLSEMDWKTLPDSCQSIIEGLLQSLPKKNNLPLDGGRPWPLPSFCEYQQLLTQSEYAAWLSIWGLRANHFTIYVNKLKHYDSLEAVVKLLQQHGYGLNEVGGVIKGHEEVGLKQASTLAQSVPVFFNDAGKQLINSCYYEFAQRFELPGEGLYLGFVTASADKIFESTDQRQA